MALTDHVGHATCAIADTIRGLSRLPEPVLRLPGLSSPGVRRLLNNLCNFDGCRFVEVGTYWGATAISASYGNKGRFVSIDDFHQFSGKDLCLENLAAHRDVAPVDLRIADYRRVPLDDLAPIDVLSYDGTHTAEATREAVEYFAPAMAEVCIVVVDDWNWADVREGVRAAKPARPWYPLAQWELFTADIADHKYFTVFPQNHKWWNGLFIGVYASKPCGLALPMA